LSFVKFFPKSEKSRRLLIAQVICYKAYSTNGFYLVKRPAHLYFAAISADTPDANAENFNLIVSQKNGEATTLFVVAERALSWG